MMQNFVLLLLLADSVLDEFELSPNTIGNIAVTRDDGIWKCGVVDNYQSKRSRLSYFTRIIGGRPAAPGSWPWQVAVLNRFRVSTVKCLYISY